MTNRGFHIRKGPALGVALGLGMLLMVSMKSALAADPAVMPSFTLPDLDGKTHASSEFLGRTVVVDFWATWCAACKEAVPRLSALQKKYGPKKLLVIGISIDKGSPEKIRKAVKKFGIDYHVLLDPESTTGAAFGFEAIPALYVFDRKGALKLAMPGYDPDQEAKFDSTVATLVK